MTALVRAGRADVPSRWALDDDKSLDDAVGAKPYPLLSLEEVANLPPLEWLVDHVFQLGELSLLYGIRACGKSLAALDLALTVASGGSWLGQPTRHGGVIYVALENVRGITPRVQAWRTIHPDADLSRVHVVTERAKWQDAARLTATCNALDPAPALVVIDTFARFIVGTEERSEKDMGLVIAELDEVKDATGAAILIVHHAGKDHSRGGRGSSAIEAATTTVVEMKGADSQRTLTCTKQNNAEEFSPVALTMQPAAESVVLTQQLSAPAASDLQGRILAHLAAAGPSSQTAIKTALSRNTNDVRIAVAVLVANGRIVVDGRRFALARPPTSSPRTNHRDAWRTEP